MQPHETYKIKEGDTLKSIANLFDTTPKKLKDFHNAYCAIKDVIGQQIPKSLQYLIIHPYAHNKNDKSSSRKIVKKILFSEGYKIPFSPGNQIVRYGYILTIRDGVGVPEKTLKYEADVQCIGKTPEADFIFEINRTSKIFIDDVETNDIADDLAEKASRVLYPLQITVNREGCWTGIYNYITIHNRWQKTKKNILRDYEGHWANQYLELCEATLADQGLLEKMLSKDYFLRILFLGVNRAYGSKLAITESRYFPLPFRIGDLQYIVTHNVNKFLDDEGRIYIEQNGYLQDDRSKTDLMNGSLVPTDAITNKNVSKTEGAYRAKYFLNANSYTVETAFITSSVVLNDEKKITIMINKLNNNMQEETFNTHSYMNEKAEAY